MPQHLRQEPSAVTPRARICAGGAGKTGVPTENGRTFVRVSRWFPSSKRCSACGFVVEKLPLSARRWTCPECGIEHDRDVNAAINIRQEGLRILELPRGPREARRVEGANPRPRRRVPLASGRPGKRESHESEARAKC
jgi:hypothetical protein